MRSWSPLATRTPSCRRRIARRSHAQSRANERNRAPRLRRAPRHDCWSSSEGAARHRCRRGAEASPSVGERRSRPALPCSSRPVVSRAAAATLASLYSGATPDVAVAVVARLTCPRQAARPGPTAQGRRCPLLAGREGAGAREHADQGDGPHRPAAVSAATTMSVTRRASAPSGSNSGSKIVSSAPIASGPAAASVKRSSSSSNLSPSG